MLPQAELLDAATGEVVLPELSLATTFWSRFRGLQLTAPLLPQQGLLLAPCRSVHTMFLRFPLDIYFCGKSGEVLARRLGASPWLTAAACAQASFVIETTASSSHPCLEVGQRVYLRPRTHTSEGIPKCLRHLHDR